MQKNFIKKVTNTSKKNFHFHCTFVAVNNTFLLYLELTIRSCAAHVQILEKNEICNFCFEVKYLLNIRAFKICMNEVHESFQEYLVQLLDYLDGIFFCESFFKYLPTRRKMNIYFDKSKELCLVRVKKVD